MLFGIGESEDANLVIVGIPWDRSSSFRRGAAEGPRLIRESTSSKLYNSYSEDLTDLASKWRFMDLGDVYADSFSQLIGRVEDVVRGGWGNRVYLFLGGDHSITYATIRAVKMMLRSRIGLIYLDAHPDLYREYDGDRYSHACTLRRIVEEGIVNGRDIVLAGIRAPTPSQIEYAKSHNITVLGIDEVEAIEDYIDNAISYYISYDLDVLDPAHAPGVGNPEPGGLSTRELVKIIKRLPRNIIAFDIVEASPPHDPTGITGFTAAKIIRETLARAREPRD